MLRDKIKLLRLSQKIPMSQDKFAQLLGTSSYRINKAEQGKRELVYSEIREILIRLDVDPYWLFDISRKEYHEMPKMSSQNCKQIAS